MANAVGMRPAARRARVAVLAASALFSAPAAAAGASGFDFLSASLQARIGEQTVLGRDAPESFREYDLRGAWGTPLETRFASDFVVGARMLASIGAFEGPGRTAVVVSWIPLLALGTADRRFTLDGGAGLALLSEHEFAQQDFGGPLQFALTAGLEAPLYGRLGAGYRFMHYSDAGAYGNHTVGADLHMAGLAWRF